MQWGDEEINQILLWNFPFGLGFGLGLAIRVMNVQPCDPKIKFPSSNLVSPKKKPILNLSKAVWRHVNFKAVGCINRSRRNGYFPSTPTLTDQTDLCLLTFPFQSLHKLAKRNDRLLLQCRKLVRLIIGRPMAQAR